MTSRPLKNINYFLLLYLASHYSCDLLSIPHHQLLEYLALLNETRPTSPYEQMLARIDELNAATPKPNQQLLATAPAQTNELTEIELAFTKTIASSVIPIITHYSAEKLLQIPTTLEDQLEQAHLAATFLERLSKKYDSFPSEIKTFIKSTNFCTTPFGKSLIGILLELQKNFEERIEIYKNIKQQVAVVKDLKKMATNVSKSIGTVLRTMFDL